MRIIVAVALVAAVLPASAAMYKWVDAQGRVQYTDTPPPANAKSLEEPKIRSNTIQSGGAPFAVQDAAKRNPVTLWISECGQLCNQARDYLAKRGVPHAVRNPTRQSEQEAWKKAAGGENSVPLLIVGNVRTLKGFDEGEWNTALDAAGYPRSAPAIKPQTIPTDPPQQAQAPRTGAPAAGGSAAAPKPGTTPGGSPATAAAPQNSGPPPR